MGKCIDSINVNNNDDTLYDLLGILRCVTGVQECNDVIQKDISLNEVKVIFECIINNYHVTGNNIGLSSDEFELLNQIMITKHIGQVENLSSKLLETLNESRSFINKFKTTY
jgi:hypothetical protein